MIPQQSECIKYELPKWMAKYEPECLESTFRSVNGFVVEVFEYKLNNGLFISCNEQSAYRNQIQIYYKKDDLFVLMSFRVLDDKDIFETYINQLKNKGDHEIQ